MISRSCVRVGSSQDRNSGPGQVGDETISWTWHVFRDGILLVSVSPGLRYGKLTPFFIGQTTLNYQRVCYIYIYNIIESNPTGSIFCTQNKWWFFFTLYDLLAFDWIMTIFHPQNGNESMMPHMHWSFSASKKHPPRPLCLYLYMCVPDLLSAKKIHLFQLLGKKTCCSSCIPCFPMARVNCIRPWRMGRSCASLPSWIACSWMPCPGRVNLGDNDSAAPHDMGIEWEQPVELLIGMDIFMGTEHICGNTCIYIYIHIWINIHYKCITTNNNGVLLGLFVLILWDISWKYVEYHDFLWWFFVGSLNV